MRVEAKRTCGRPLYRSEDAWTREPAVFSCDWCPRTNSHARQYTAFANFVDRHADIRKARMLTAIIYGRGDNIALVSMSMSPAAAMARVDIHLSAGWVHVGAEALWEQFITIIDHVVRQSAVNSPAGAR